jgi:WD40 repeat protein
VAFSPRGDLVATGGYDGRARLWTLEGQPVGEPLQGHRSVLTSLDFSPDGERIATAGLDNTVRLWTVSGVLLGTLPRSPTAPPLPGE